MTEFTLRPAQEDDFPQIKQWVRASGINPLGLDWQRFTMAETQDGEPVGCVQLKPHFDGTIELASLVVAEEWRSKGVARLLIEDAVASQDGPLYLMCRSSLGPLYEKFGFRALEEEQMPRYYRWIAKLARYANRLRDTDEHLLIMRQG